MNTVTSYGKTKKRFFRDDPSLCCIYINIRNPWEIIDYDTISKDKYALDKASCSTEYSDVKCPSNDSLKMESSQAFFSLFICTKF